MRDQIVGERLELQPSVADLWLIAVFTLATRLICLFMMMHLLRLSALQFATQTGDGGSYIAYARFILGSRAGLIPTDLRVFPGTPILIAILYALHLPMAVASLGLCIGSSVVANTFAAALTRDKRIGFAMIALTPDWLIVGCTVASEAPLLALTVCGLYVATRIKRDALSAVAWGGAGLILGFAGTVRPMACFAVLGYLVFSARRGFKARAAIVGTVAALVIFSALIFLHFWLGDAFHGLKIYANDPDAYGGHLFWLPGRSLLTTPFWYPVPHLKIPLVWGEAALLILACILVVWNFRVLPPTDMDWISLPWLWGNTAFVLCIGTHWGFNIFKRLLLPAWPAEIWALRRLLPRRYPLVIWGALWIVSAAIAIFLVTRKGPAPASGLAPAVQAASAAALR